MNFYEIYIYNICPFILPIWIETETNYLRKYVYDKEKYLIFLKPNLYQFVHLQNQHFKFSTTDFCFFFKKSRPVAKNRKCNT